MAIVNVGLKFEQNKKFARLVRHVDSNFACDLNNRSSSIGYTINLTTSKLEIDFTDYLTLSTIETRVYSAEKAVKEVIWRRAYLMTWVFFRNL